MRLFYLLIALTILTSCSNSNLSPVEINGVKWSDRNLSVTKFRNGDEIPIAKNADEWNELSKNKKPVACYYKFNEGNDKMGLYYNYYALHDPRGLVPEGWHIPSKQEVENLVTYYNKLDKEKKLLLADPLGDQMKIQENGYYDNVSKDFYTSPSWWTINTELENENSWCFEARFTPRYTAEQKRITEEFNSKAAEFAAAAAEAPVGNNVSSNESHSIEARNDYSTEELEKKLGKVEKLLEFQIPWLSKKYIPDYSKHEGHQIRCIKNELADNDGSGQYDNTGRFRYKRSEFMNTFMDKSNDEILKILGNPNKVYENIRNRQDARAALLYYNLTFDNSVDDPDRQVILYFTPERVWPYTYRVAKIKFSKVEEEPMPNW